MKVMKDLKKGIIIALPNVERNATPNQGEKQPKPSKNRREPEEEVLLDRELSLHDLHGRCSCFTLGVRRFSQQCLLLPLH